MLVNLWVDSMLVNLLVDIMLVNLWEVIKLVQINETMTLPYLHTQTYSPQGPKQYKIKVIQMIGTKILKNTYDTKEIKIILVKEKQ